MLGFLVELIIMNSSQIFNVRDLGIFIKYFIWNTARGGCNISEGD
jgi:hypothetical protein